MSESDLCYLVVDTNIACALGYNKPDSKHPAPACFRALDAVRNCESLGVAISQPIVVEWKRHAPQSYYIWTWLADMKSRKKVKNVYDPQWKYVSKLRQSILALTEKQQDDILKDLHLVELAMFLNQRVLSLDEKQARLLLQILADIPALEVLHWANPQKYEEKTIEWLAGGAPDEPLLCVSARLA